LKSNAMAGAVSLVGVGLCGIAAAMLLQATGTRADASPATSSTVIGGPHEPTVVWYGVTAFDNPDFTGRRGFVQYHRLWSDGRLDVRAMELNFSNCGYTFSYVCNWVTVPPASNGDGVACRQDVNGDGNVDGDDLGLLLIEWGDAVCQVQPTYPCLTLDGLQLPQ
jgi:hypothetical protein